MAALINEVTPAMWDAADLEQRKRWRAVSWLVGARIGPGYPYQRDPEYGDLRGPAQEEVEQAGKLQLGVTSAAEAQAIANQQKAKVKAAKKRERKAA